MNWPHAGCKYRWAKLHHNPTNSQHEYELLLRNGSRKTLVLHLWYLGLLSINNLSRTKGLSTYTSPIEAKRIPIWPPSGKWELMNAFNLCGRSLPCTYCQWLLPMQRESSRGVRWEGSYPLQIFCSGWTEWNLHSKICTIYCSFYSAINPRQNLHHLVWIYACGPNSTNLNGLGVPFTSILFFTLWLYASEASWEKIVHHISCTPL